VSVACAAIALAAVAGAAGGGASAAAAAALLVAAGLATGLVTPLLAALVLLGAIYPEGGQAIPAPIYAGALLLTAELAFWWLDERDAGRVEPGTGTPRLLGIVAATATGVAAAALVLLASEIDTARSPLATTAGVAAVLGSVAVLLVLARLRGSR
jgi:hypothetical protein